MKARLPQGYGKGAGNMGEMLKQAQKMQNEMKSKQEELAEREFSASVGGGAVSVIITGAKTVKSITIGPEVVDPEEIDMLQDLVVAAVNEGLRIVDEVTAQEMEKITGAMGMPGMF